MAVVKSDGGQYRAEGVPLHQASHGFSTEMGGDVLDQVIKQISLRVVRQSSEIRVRLEPESLGEVIVKVRVENNQVDAQIDVTQQSVKQILEAGLPQLRHALSERGVDFQRLDVVVDGHSSSEESRNESDGGGKSHNGRHQGIARRNRGAVPDRSPVGL